MGLRLYLFNSEWVCFGDLEIGLVGCCLLRIEFGDRGPFLSSMENFLFVFMEVGDTESIVLGAPNGEDDFGESDYGTYFREVTDL